ncbi:MAG: DegT/DnrJ/EryC1/StrS family aminotransferase [Bdellovibrionales bacterium]
MSTPSKFPFFDVTRQFVPLKDQVMEKFSTLLDKQAFILGDTVAQFEKDIAQWMNVKHAITVANGTDALVVALRALDVGHGDEVITPAFSFFASTSSIMLVGAKPVFVDVDPRTFNIDPALIEKAITPKTKAIMPVQLFGQCSDMDPIMQIAKKHNLKVLEDFAQTIGATYKGKQAGTIGDIGSTSFYPTKNLGGAGEGGMITTNDDALAEKVKLIRVHGMPRRYVHDILGTNSRLNALQVAYLAVKLPHLKTWMQKRNDNANTYMKEFQQLTDKGLVLPKVAEGNTHVWNQFVVRVPNRDAIQKKMADEGVPTEIYYPFTIPEQKPLRPFAPEKGWPVSETASRDVLALPIFPELKKEEQQMVIAALKKVLS